MDLTKYIKILAVTSDMLALKMANKCKTDSKSMTDLLVFFDSGVLGLGFRFCLSEEIISI